MLPQGKQLPGQYDQWLNPNLQPSAPPMESPEAEGTLYPALPNSGERQPEARTVKVVTREQKPLFNSMTKAGIGLAIASYIIVSPLATMAFGVGVALTIAGVGSSLVNKSLGERKVAETEQNEVKNKVNWKHIICASLLTGTVVTVGLAALLVCLMAPLAVLGKVALDLGSMTLQQGILKNW